MYHWRDDDCGRGRRRLTLWWATDDATSARIRRQGGDWEEVSVGLSSHTTCAEEGSTWELEVSNDAGATDSATWR
jgi:hypothetical protein